MEVLRNEIENPSSTDRRLIRRYGINMQNGINTAMAELRKIKKDRRKADKKTKRRKHEAAQEYMRTKGKTRKSKHKGRTKGKGGVSTSTPKNTEKK